MLVYRRGNVVHQIGLDADHNYAAYRVGENNTWQNWSRLDAFGCSTPADLASLLGGNYLFAPQSIPNNNLLNISKGGSYTITPETTNSPNSEYYYFCIVIGSSSVFSALAIDTRMRDAYVGTIRSSDESVTWKKITLT